MPAVNPARLQTQIDHLITFFDTPLAFHRQLQNIFDLYANRTLRIGEYISSPPLIPMYNLPGLVARQVELDLKPHILENPETAIAIADELWTDNYFETRHLAGFILGMVTMDDPEPIRTRLEKWLTPDLDKTLISDLLMYGTRSIQSGFPAVWEKFIDSYLTDKNPKMVALGLQGLRASLHVNSDKLLPSVFRMLSPLLRDVDQEISTELEHLIKALVSVSPTETTFYLKQAVSVSESKGTARLVKQCLPFFEDELKQELNDSLS